MFIKEVWFRISSIGVNDYTPMDKRKYIILTNQLAVAWIILIIPYLFIFANKERIGFILLSLMILTHVFVLMLNGMKLTNLSRVLEGFLPLTILNILAAHIIPSQEEHLPASFYLLNTAFFIIPFLLLSLEEYIYIIMCVVVSICIFLGFEWLNDQLSLQRPETIYYLKSFNIFNYIISIGLLTIGLVNLKRINNSIQKHVTHLLEESRIANTILEQQKEEIIAQRDEIEAQRDEIDNQKKNVENQIRIILDQADEITQSILYARRIQNAMLPPPDELEKYFSEYFVFYRPKDIVSGDFYWVDEAANKIVIAVCDCTGHGIPGGFLSMLCTAFLNEVVHFHARNPNDLSPGLLLNELRKMVIKAMHQKGRVGENRDGMDMSLCIVDKSKRTLQYAGANNSLFIGKNGELHEIKGDRMPVSFHSAKDAPFQSRQVDFEPGDIFYTFTDGFADQFGEKEGKKYRFKNFREYIDRIQHSPINIQKELLENEFLTWKGKSEQVDDVLVMGYRF